MTDKGWTITEVRESTWAKRRLRELTAFEITPGDYGPEIKGVTLDELLTRADETGLGPSESQCNLPSQVTEWRRALGLPGTYALEKATRSLGKDQRLKLLSSWFNGAGGLPRPKTGAGRLGDRVRLYLGHPSLLNQFILWVISYLGVHETVDGRICPDCQRVIDVCREIQGESPSRRF